MPNLSMYPVYTSARSMSIDEGSNDLGGLRSTEARPRAVENAFLNILKAEVDLVDVRVLENVSFSGQEYSGVLAYFCALNWTVYKEKPHLTPMYAGLVSKSHCDFPLVVDLCKTIKTIERYKGETRFDGIKTLKLSGIVFHQSRCGSTWATNLLTAMNPLQHRVYSEPEPPAHVLVHLETGLLNEQQAKIVLRHVVYLMKRSNNPAEQRLFIKLQSTMSRYISIIQQALPEAPWMFLYRDGIQVMMSYIKDKNYRHAICQGGAVRGLPPIRDPPASIKEMARRHAPLNYDFTYEGYCAANIATVTEPIIRHINHRGFVINYNSLPSGLYRRWADSWNLTIGRDEMKRMQNVSAQYSKGRGRTGRLFLSDSHVKDSAAWDRVRDASIMFLQTSYDELETIANAK